MSAAMSLVLCLVATLVSQSTAHFLLNYPPTIGFDDSLEGQSPCGSFTPDFSTDNVTNFYVGGDSLAMTSIHPEATWLFRATLDQTASGNWTDLLPAVTQTGLGDYCEPNVLVPLPWAGSKGIIGVVQDAPDGILYQVRRALDDRLACVDFSQCAAVNFVAGKGTVPSVCTNGTGLTAVFAADPSLSK